MLHNVLQSSLRCRLILNCVIVANAVNEASNKRLRIGGRFSLAIHPAHVQLL